MRCLSSSIWIFVVTALTILVLQCGAQLFGTGVSADAVADAGPSLTGNYIGAPLKTIASLSSSSEPTTTHPSQAPMISRRPTSLTATTSMQATGGGNSDSPDRGSPTAAFLLTSFSYYYNLFILFTRFYFGFNWPKKETWRTRRRQSHSMGVVGLV